MTYSISCRHKITCRHMLSLLRSSNLQYDTWSLHILHTSEFMHDYNTICVHLSKSISWTFLSYTLSECSLNVWAPRPEWAYGCVSCGLQVQGLWRELQFNPNGWLHYVSAYNIKKLCKWIRCYTTMLLLSKHKQHCTNGQMFTTLKYDEICPWGGIHDYTYTHKGRARYFPEFSSLQMYKSQSASMNVELQLN